MIRQTPVFESATTIRTKNKTSKNCPQGHHSIHLQRSHSQTNWKFTPALVRVRRKQHRPGSNSRTSLTNTRTN